MTAAVVPRVAWGLKDGKPRRAIAAALCLLLGCSALAALLTNSADRSALVQEIPPVHGLPAPAMKDEAVWKQTVQNMFGGWQAATNSNVNLVAPSDESAYRGGGGARVGPYRPPAATTLKGMLLPSAEDDEMKWEKQIADMQSNELSENQNILNSVGVQKFKMPAERMNKWAPTVILPIAKSGEFKHAMEYEHAMAAAGTATATGTATEQQPSPEQGSAM